MAQIPPMDLKFQFSIPPGAGMYDIDVAQVLSLANRKAMRQGYEYVISNLEFVTDGDAICGIAVLPTTWMMANSWVKAYHAWQTQQDSVLDEEPSIASRYRDFKIFFDTFHEQAGFAANLLPVGFDITFGLDEAYDWEHTNIEIPTDGGALPPVRFNMHAIGATTATSKALIHGYGLSRARPQQDSPNVPLYGGWLQAISDVAEIDPFIRQDIIHENENPPYPVAISSGANQSQEFYPGGTNQATSWVSYVHDILVTRNNTSLAMDSSGPFTAPCGLIRLDILDGSEAPLSKMVFLTLAAGPYKGVMARPMKELN